MKKFLNWISLFPTSVNLSYLDKSDHEAIEDDWRQVGEYFRNIIESR